MWIWVDWDVMHALGLVWSRSLKFDSFMACMSGSLYDRWLNALPDLIMSTISGRAYLPSGNLLA